MDAHAHLISLGWQGDGHALDARPYKQKGRSGLAYDPKEVRSTGTNGLVKPLLVSQRPHKFGIGKKAHEPAAGTEWWLSGFEKALGNIGKSESERETTTTSGTATPESSAGGGYKGKHAGLYGFFVKGQPIGGTIGEQRQQQWEHGRKSKKRKSGQIVDGAVDAGSDESSSDVASKEKRKEDPAKEFEQVGAFLAARDKDEKRKKKAQKAGALEQFQLVGQFFETTEKKKQSRIREVIEADEEEEESATVRVETKEERRERRRRRKEEKEKAALALREVNAGVPKPVISSSDEVAAKAARKAERRRRKEMAVG